MQKGALTSFALYDLYIAQTRVTNSNLKKSNRIILFQTTNSIQKDKQTETDRYTEHTQKQRSLTTVATHTKMTV